MLVSLLHCLCEIRWVRGRLTNRFVCGELLYLPVCLQDQFFLSMLLNLVIAYQIIAIITFFKEPLRLARVRVEKVLFLGHWNWGRLLSRVSWRIVQRPGWWLDIHVGAMESVVRLRDRRWVIFNFLRGRGLGCDSCRSLGYHFYGLLWLRGGRLALVTIIKGLDYWCVVTCLYHGVLVWLVHAGASIDLTTEVRCGIILMGLGCA